MNEPSPSLPCASNGNSDVSGGSGCRSAAPAAAAAAQASVVEQAMQTSSEDRGHRVGNFHNYYAFHPPDNRIDVLEECGLIDVVAQRLLYGGSSRWACTQHAPAVGDSSDCGSSKKKQRTDAAENVSMLSATKWHYCDLGCNEGDLTIKFADTILRRCRELCDASDEKDSGGRSSTSRHMLEMKCLGLDIDPVLIERANTKYGDTAAAAAAAAAANPNRDSITASFEVCNLCDESQHLSIYHSFLGKHLSKYHSFLDKNTTPEPLPGRSSLSLPPQQRFDVTTLFSTTMWIHIHSGDEGLRDFLRRTCDNTNMIVVEPQPSKCYRQANVRLRKMNRPELVSVVSKSLGMRSNIEKEVDRVITECGFRRVISEGYVKEDLESQAKRTAWQRQLQLYIRE